MYRTFCRRARSSGLGGNVDRRLVDGGTNVGPLDRPTSLNGDRLLVHHIVTEGAIVKYDGEQGHPIVGCAPNHGRVHEPISVTHDPDGDLLPISSGEPCSEQCPRPVAQPSTSRAT